MTMHVYKNVPYLHIWFLLFFVLEGKKGGFSPHSSLVKLYNYNPPYKLKN